MRGPNPGLAFRVVHGRPVLLVFAAWTVLIWATRIDNVLGDPDLSTGGQAARLALAVSFVVLGASVGVLAVRNRPLTRPGRSLVAVAVGWTIAVWLVRGGQIVVGDHSAAFVAVHLVLATASIGLALAAARTLRTPPLPFGHSGGQAEAEGSSVVS
jgi:hypothetical protein